MSTETEFSRKGKNLHAAKLLLVEDDPALSELLEYRFTNEGYQVRTTSDGDEALLLATEDVPDLVILDWMIEGTSGIEVCRRLRRDKETAHVPIIMLTAEVGDITLDPVAHKVTRRSRTLQLGPTEYRLLKFFMESPGRVFSRGQLLDGVWGTESEIELRTVDVHIRRLRKAIEIDGAKDPVRTVRSAGYSLEA